MTKFPEYMYVHLNKVWKRTFHFKDIIAIFLGLQTLWPNLLSHLGCSSGLDLSKTKFLVTPIFFTFLAKVDHDLFAWQVLKTICMWGEIWVWTSLLSCDISVVVIIPKKLPKACLLHVISGHYSALPILPEEWYVPFFFAAWLLILESWHFLWKISSQCYIKRDDEHCFQVQQSMSSFQHVTCMCIVVSCTN